MDALRESVVAAKMHYMPHERIVDVNLWKKHLARVPNEVLERLEIETLVLADNDLAELPPKIGNLKHLRMLDIGHNALTQLPEELGQLTGLRDFLYLHDNQLASLPTSLCHLTALRYQSFVR